MNPARWAWRLYIALVILLCLPWPAFGQETGSTFVVASPRLNGFYRGTVMLAAPIGQGRHIGLILNRPTKVRMGEEFPDHPPSTKVTDPIYFGGPVNTNAIGALVRASSAPHAKSFELAPGVWLVLDAEAVDLIMEADPNAARYFAGFVIWEPGELKEEVVTGKMVLRPVDPQKIFLQDTTNLHEELVPKGLAL